MNVHFQMVKAVEWILMVDNTVGKMGSLYLVADCEAKS